MAEEDQTRRKKKAAHDLVLCLIPVVLFVMLLQGGSNFCESVDEMVKCDHSDQNNIWDDFQIVILASLGSRRDKCV